MLYVEFLILNYIAGASVTLVPIIFPQTRAKCSPSNGRMLCVIC